MLGKKQFISPLKNLMHYIHFLIKDITSLIQVLMCVNKN